MFQATSDRAQNLLLLGATANSPITLAWRGISNMSSIYFPILHERRASAARRPRSAAGSSR